LNPLSSVPPQSLNFAAESWSFPALPPINFLASFDLNIEFRSRVLLQKSGYGSKLIGVDFRTTAKFNNDLVKGDLSYTVFGEVEKCR